MQPRNSTLTVQQHSSLQAGKGSKCHCKNLVLVLAEARSTLTGKKAVR